MLLLSYVISANFYQVVLIQGSSMLPTLTPYQFCIVQKQYDEIERGAIIAFSNENTNLVLVKRVAGVPYDRLVIRDKSLYVNGAIPDFYNTVEFAEAGILSREIVLGEGEYFVIGDNPSHSIDSRDSQVGILLGDEIIGVLLISRD